MNFRVRLIAVILPASLILGVGGIGLPGASARDEPADEAPFAQQYESHVTVNADHTATEVSTEKIKVLTQSAIETVSEQQLTFIEGIETLDTIEAYTVKADGRRIPVPAKNILTQDAASDSPATYYRDEKQRTVIFPDVGVGDTLVMTSRRMTTWGKTLNDFDERRIFARSAGYTSVRITVEAPAAIGLQVKATGNSVVDIVDDPAAGLRRYTVSVNPAPYAPDEAGAVSVLDRDPVVLLSTYKSYEEVGASYGRNALPKARVTPDIAALAEEITTGITDRKAQAAAIDAWMKKNIRYVGVYLSFERIVPNEAATVLQNRFGDCKDKATLMMALLAAKGIAAEQALVDLGRAYTLTDPPVSGAFNHVILYLPEFDLYDDPTANLSAFGVMSFYTYDKPVVRVSAAGARLTHTPAMRPADHTTYSKTSINVAADGTVTGQTEESDTGAFAATLRSDEKFLQGMGSAVAARRRLQRASTPGTGQFDLGNFVETTDPAVLKGSFALDEKFRVPVPDGKKVIPDGMLFNALPGSYLLGYRLNDRKSAFVCYAGSQTEDIELTIAPPFPLPQPPEPVAIDNRVFSYQSTVKVDERTLKIHREFVSRVERQACPPDLEPVIAPDLETVRVNVSNRLAFGTANLSGTVNSPFSIATRANAAAPQTPAVLAPAALPPPAVPNLATAPNPAPPLDLTKVVATGQRLRVEFLYALEPDCSSMGVTSVRILEPPQHGKLTVENGQGFTGFAKDNQRHDCNMRKSDGTLVFYAPEPGFAGHDSITLDIIFPTGQSSRQHYAIDVR
jgi:transglutaminase-like putative cysteine protease